MASHKRSTFGISMVNKSRKSGFQSNFSRTGSYISKKSETETQKVAGYPQVVHEGELIHIQPLLPSEKRVTSQDKDTPTDMSITSLTQTQSHQLHGGGSSMQGALGMFKSAAQTGSSMGTTDTRSDDYDDGLYEGESMMKDTRPTETKAIVQPAPVLTESDLNEEIELHIEETPTIWLFDMPPKYAANDDPETASIRDRNEKYSELLRNKVGNDSYTDHGMVTFGEPSISKPVQTDKIAMQDEDILAATWDMYDTFEALKLTETDAPKDAEPAVVVMPLPVDESGVTQRAGSAEQKAVDIRKSFDRAATQRTVSSFTDSELFGIRDGSVVTTLRDIAESDRIMNSDELRHSLFIMERALNLNTYQSVLATYRDKPVIEDDNKPVIQAIIRAPQHASMELLWRFGCTDTRGCNISAMSWNKQNKDILAVAYGQYDFNDQKAGLVCCWSLKNVNHPERIYHLPSGATAIDWSITHPNLLAVGMYDGIVFIFDARKLDNKPIINTASAEYSGRHLGPVRQLEWVLRDTGEDSSEVLVSVSSDGCVTQWSLKKAFESSNLMKLKRLTIKLPGMSTRQKDKKVGALISQYAFGSSIAFRPSETNIYLAGTDSGHIYRCSCSYTEQHLETYIGHTGPVYAIQWSPFMDEVFLSCAADWTIKLWHVDQPEPILSFTSATKSVNTISWSPRSSLIFASVNDGAVEIWDLNHSKLDPLMFEKSTDESEVVTCVSFSQNSESIFVGDNQGQVTVYKLNGLSEIPRNQSEALDKVIQKAGQS